MTRTQRLNWSAFLLKCWVDAFSSGEWDAAKADRWFFYGAWRN